jgi:deoxyribose-phosphate aldolase
MRGAVSGRMGVKASGGIRDYETAARLLAAGANRIGTSAGLAIAAGGGESDASAD